MQSSLVFGVLNPSEGLGLSLVAEHHVILVLDGSKLWFEGILVEAHHDKRRQVCWEKGRVS